MNDDDPVVWRLVVDIVGPGFRDRVSLDSEDPMELQPEVVDVGGVSYEHYRGDDGEYVEFRQDYVAQRRMVVLKPSAPAVVMDEDETRMIERRKNDQA